MGPALEPSVQEGYGHVGVSPEEGHEDDRGLEYLCEEDKQRAGIFQPG